MSGEALSRDDIFEVDDLPRVWVPVPEWRGGVWVRVMTAGEREGLEEWLLSTQGDGIRKDQRAHYLALAVCDENGNRMFGPEDYKALSGKSALACDRIIDAFRRVNKMGTADLEESEKNSESAG